MAVVSFQPEILHWNHRKNENNIKKTEKNRNSKQAVLFAINKI